MIRDHLSSPYSTFNPTIPSKIFGGMVVWGAMGALAFSPFFVFPLLALSSVVLLRFLERVYRNSHAFGIGFFYGFGYGLTGLYWMSFAFHTVGRSYLIPLSLLGPSLILGLLIGCLSLCLYRLAHTPLTRAIGFGLGWGLLEWTQGHWLFGGFPWNLMGYIWPLEILQSTSYMGIYGLSLFTAISFGLLSLRSIKVTGGVILSFSLLWIGGSYNLHQTEPVIENPTYIRLVQPVIPQNQKWNSERWHDNLLRHISLSQRPSNYPLSIVIWPESSVPFFIDKQPVLRTLLKAAIPEKGILILGAPRHNPLNDTLHVGLFALNKQGDILAFYDKSHLVPFGEYVPLSSRIPIQKLVHGPRDFTPGEGIQTISLPEIAPFSPLICFEAIFPGNVVATPRPEWLLNITNDAWYGHTSGPYQHLQTVRVRAIEEGLPLIRVANNGISAVIDAKGRIKKRLELDVYNHLDVSLPKALSPPFYARQGDLVFWVLFSVLFFILIILHTKGEKNG